MVRAATRVVPVLLLLLWLAPAGRAAAPCSVPSASHPTIQAALDDDSCDPVGVGPGTFDESLQIDRSVEIVGAGTTSTIIDGLTGSSTIRMDSGPPNTVTVRNLTVTGGGSGNPDGGGFQVASDERTLNLFDVLVTGNQGSDGGGIWVDTEGTLNMTGGGLIGNTATNFGGGIYAGTQFSVTLTGVRVEGNHADSGDGGLSLDVASFTGRKLLVTGNSAPFVGGISVFATDSVLIEDSVVAGNTAEAGHSGGLLLNAVPEAPLIMRNSTVSGNRATGDFGGIRVVDGIFLGTNLTISNNAADSDQRAPRATAGGSARRAPGARRSGTPSCSGTPMARPGRTSPSAAAP